ncbi:hypothetical protein BT96DRAFT_950072 [Gymnopus androsaceus JB14]|uniref:Uncharacterized protein n=1 Tax=Gymnopus androsaceus JB14 TaxID=1447944 RepID=A0A6A4GI09_9AGAR|nr:hypothetical protein BT96DRAFT_950072 [Gymnopus androsaceus JB14]
MSPLMLRPREGVEEPSTHGGGASVADIKSETKDHSIPERPRESGVPPVTTTSHQIPSGGFHSASETQANSLLTVPIMLRLMMNQWRLPLAVWDKVPDKDFEELRRQLALYNEERAKVKAQMDRIHDPTLGDKLLAFSHTATVRTTTANPPPDTQVESTASVAAHPMSKANKNRKIESLYSDSGIATSEHLESQNTQTRVLALIMTDSPSTRPKLPDVYGIEDLL